MRKRPFYSDQVGSLQPLLQFRPVVAEGLHGWEEQVGSGVQERVVGQWAGVDGNGEDAGSHGRLYAEGCIFHDDGFGGTDHGFPEAFQVGFGVGLAAGDVEAGDHDIWAEQAREMAVEALEQALLSAAGDEEDLKALASDGVEQFGGAGHDRGFGQGVEAPGFGVIDGLYLLGCGGVAPLAACQQVDGAAAGASFVEIDVLAAHL